MARTWSCPAKLRPLPPLPGEATRIARGAAPAAPGEADKDAEAAPEMAADRPEDTIDEGRVNPSRIFIERPVATSLFMIAILLVGIVGFFFLPLSALPEVDYPTIQV